MNDRCLFLLNKLRAREYYEFLRMALGMHSFQHNVKLDPERSFFKEINKGSSKMKQKPYYYVVQGKDNVRKTFHAGEDNIITATDFFSEMDDSVLECILRIAMSKMGQAILSPDEEYNSEDESYRTDVFSPYFGRIIFNNFLEQRRNYNFILGAGINDGFGIGSWSQLLENLDIFIEEKQFIGNRGSLTKFEQKLANTNYVSPQLAKNIDREAYFKILYNWLYSNQVDDYRNAEHRTLYKVVRIANEKSDCRVLTFNYDNLFEQLSAHFYHEKKWATIYHGARESKKMQTGPYKIIHLHGYIPSEGKVLKKMKDSIVLSTLEYMQAYRSQGAYCFRTFLEQLESTNLMIGNSISDYEEQKVLRQNIRDYPYRYQFMLTKKNDELWMDTCQMMFLMQMGVIPVFFDDWNEMNKFLQMI